MYLEHGEYPNEGKNDSPLTFKLSDLPVKKQEPVPPVVEEFVIEKCHVSFLSILWNITQ